MDTPELDQKQNITELKSKLIPLYLNSTILYLAAFLVVHISAQLLACITAECLFDIPTIFHHLKIICNIPDILGVHFWTVKAILGFYSVVPIFCFILCFFLIRSLIKNKSKQRNLYKLFTLWCYIHAMNLIFGALIVGIPIMKGFGFVPGYLYIPKPTENFLIIISILLLIGNGIFLNRQFGNLAYNNNILIEKYTHILFKLVLVLMPYITVSLIFFIFGLPDDTTYENLLLLTTLLQIIPIIPFAMISERRNLQTKLIEKVSHPSLYFLGSLVLLLIIFIIYINLILH